MENVPESEEKDGGGCGGWKDSEDCPHNGIFHTDSDTCQECYEDAMKAISETCDTTTPEEAHITWLVGEVDRLNEILNIGTNPKGGESNAGRKI